MVLKYQHGCDHWFLLADMRLCPSYLCVIFQSPTPLPIFPCPPFLWHPQMPPRPKLLPDPSDFLPSSLTPTLHLCGTRVISFTDPSTDAGKVLGVTTARTVNHCTPPRNKVLQPQVPVSSVCMLVINLNRPHLRL